MKRSGRRVTAPSRRTSSAERRSTSRWARSRTDRAESRERTSAAATTRSPESLEPRSPRSVTSRSAVPGCRWRRLNKRRSGRRATTVESTTAAGYHPDAKPITVRLVAEEQTGRLLGAQIVGGPGAAKRIDVAATAITAGMTLEQVADLDLGYAPPLSPLWDPIAITARKAIQGESQA